MLVDSTLPLLISNTIYYPVIGDSLDPQAVEVPSEAGSMIDISVKGAKCSITNMFADPNLAI